MNDDSFVPETVVHWQYGAISDNNYINVHSQTVMTPIYLLMFSFFSAPASMGQLPPEGHPFNPTVVSTTIIISVDTRKIIYNTETQTVWWLVYHG